MTVTIANTAVQQNATPAEQAQARAQLKEQIRQTIDAANEAGRQAVQEAKIAQGGTRIAIPPVPPIPPAGQGFTLVQPRSNEIPPQAVDMAMGFFVMCAVIVIGWPLARAFGRRIERRGDSPAVSAATSEQLQRIEQAVEAMAIEVERISESQRFMAKLQNGAAAERLAINPADRH